MSFEPLVSLKKPEAKGANGKEERAGPDGWTGRRRIN